MPLGNPMGYMTGMGGFNPAMLQQLMGGLGRQDPGQSLGMAAMNQSQGGAMGGGPNPATLSGMMGQMGQGQNPLQAGVQSGFSRMQPPQMQPAMQQNQSPMRRNGNSGGVGGGRMF